MTRGSSSLGLALPLAALLLSGTAGAQGRKLNGPLAASHSGQVRAFVLADGHLVYHGYGTDSSANYTLWSTPLSGGPTRELFSYDYGIYLLGSVPGGTRVLFRAGQAEYYEGELYSAPADGSEPAVRLHPPFARGEDVYSYLISPDGLSVVYEAVVASTSLGGYKRRLFHVPVDGSSPPVLLTPHEQLRIGYSNYAITPDSARVVFLGETPGATAELYSVPLSGDPVPAQLSPTLHLSNVSGFQISPDGLRVVYLFSQYDNDLRISFADLVSTPVDGSAPAVRLNEPLQPGRTVGGSFRISPDSTRVVYVSDQASDEVFAVYSVPIGGGSSALLASPSGTYYSPLLITPDGSLLVYRTPSRELYCVRMDGSRPALKLSGSHVVGDEVELAPDASRVVFIADQSVYSVRLDATDPPVPLVPGTTNQFIHTLAITPDSERVLFMMMLRTGTYYDDVFGQLYSAPLDGSAPALRLDSTEMWVGHSYGARGVTAYIHDLATGHAFYRADQHEARVFHLYSAPIDGSATDTMQSGIDSVQISGEVHWFQVTPDGESALFSATLEAGYGQDDDEETYTVPLHGPPESVRVPMGGALSPDSRRVMQPFTFDIYDPHVGLKCASLAPGAQVLDLHPSSATGDVADERFTPDSTRVVYRYVLDDDAGCQLFSVPVDRRQPVELTRWSTGFVTAFEITPDSRRVLFLGGPVPGLTQLYSAPLDGVEPPTRLTPPLALDGNVTSFALSPDGERVVYTAEQELYQVVELFSMSVGGGPSTRLNAVPVTGGDVTSFRISPDSRRVVFLADQDTDQVFELYGAPIDGIQRRRHAAALAPSYVPAKLVALDGSMERILAFEISPDSTRVVVRGDLEMDEVVELFSVPLDGTSAPVKLSRSASPLSDVRSFQIAASGERVVYVGDLERPNKFELFSAPIDASAAPLRLNVHLGPDRDVNTTNAPFQLDAVGRWVLYNADANTDDVHELFAVSVDGRLPGRRINGRLLSSAPATVVGRFSNRGVVYLAEEDTPGATELYLDESIIGPLPPIRAR